MKRNAIRADQARNEKASSDSGSQMERATQGLREMLLCGAFRPGQRIAEIPLSKRLGVSRTPLRLAFERLEREGLVKSLPQSGFAVSEFTINDIWDAFETRGILEGASARFAAERLKSPAQLDALRKLNRDMEEFSDSEDESLTNYLELNERFHLAIFDLANNPALRRAVEQIYSVPFVSPSGRVILRKRHPEWSKIRIIAEEHHRSIVDAIERREGTRAESLAREHSRIARLRLEEALADQKFLGSIPGGSLIKIHSTRRA